jgi:hypothetical protein
MEELVKLARKTLEDYFDRGKFQIKKFNKFKEKKGVFVTLHTFPDNELRGCIGFTEPIYPLFEAVQRAAMEAAFSDPRFPPLKKEELNKVILEVSVLTFPKIINGKPDGYLDKIEDGKDGLILEHGTRKGILLPQVWESIPDKKEFLETLCWKSGLTGDYWLDEKTKLYKFYVKIFREKEPRGEIEEINLGKK